ncbi:MAG: MBL fold metallo-hydrolase [Bacillota bacterium]
MGDKRLTIQPIAPGIFCILIPVPFALKWVNCYLIQDSPDWVLVDTGLNTEECMDTWWQVFDRLGIGPGNLRTIVITHFHPDHYGAAGRLQSWSGAEVLMSATDCRAASLAWNQTASHHQSHTVYLMRNGVPAALASEVVGMMAGRIPWVKPEPEGIGLLQGGEKIKLGRSVWTVMVTPGHTDGHLCLYQPDQAWLISGDHLLPHITSNISLWPERNNNPLQDYLSSLGRMEKLRVSLVLPAHGEAFGGFHQRIAEMREHHNQRLRLIFEEVKQGKDTAFEVMGAVFGTALSLSDIRFAIAETLAHLEYLVHQNLLQRFDEGYTYYR